MPIHKPWIGPDYHADGAGIAVLGYSHYLGKGDDFEDYTISFFDSKHPEYQDAQVIPYFKSIAAAFNVPAKELFNDIIFLNLIPHAIGSTEAKYDTAPHDVAVAGSKRLFEVLKSKNAGKLFVFSEKAWDSLPATTLAKGLPLSKSNPYTFNSFVDAPQTVCFRFRHTAFASKEELNHMREAVSLAMARPADAFLNDIKAGSAAA